MTDQNTEGTPAPGPDMTTPEGRAQAQTQIAMQFPANVPDKFKREDGTVDGDALLQSYLHLEQKQSSPDPTPSQSQEPTGTPADSSTTAQSQDASSSDDPASLAEALEGPKPPEGADLWLTAKQQLQEKGTVDDAVVNALVQSGVPTEAIQAMAAGVLAQRKNEVQAAYDAVGGKENFTATMEWARSNLNDAERAAFAEALKGPGAIFALQGIASRAATAGAPSGQVNTSEGGTIAPNPDSVIQPHRSAQDMQNAMMDPKYRLDPEYRKKVDRQVMAGAGIDPSVTRNI
jgi:hypothetical protein